MFHLRILGSIELEDEAGREVSAVLAQPKRLALLIYLAAGANAFHRRDTLLGLFWPELDTARARGALNQALRFLRKELGGAGAGVLLSRGDEEVRIDPSKLACDARELHEAAAAGRHDQVLTLYRGELLAGFFVSEAQEFEEWVERERVLTRRLAAQSARALAEDDERQGRMAAAVEHARFAVELADTDERAVRELLALLERAGDHAGAVHVYDEFAERLSTEYGTEPATETRAVFERNHAGTTNGAPKRPDSSLPTPASSSAALPPVESAARPSLIARTLRRRLVAYPLGVVVAGAVAWAAVIVLGASGIGPTASLISRGTLNRQELLVLTDFRLSGVDTAVGAAVNWAVRTGLTESRDIRLLSAARVGAALTLMRRRRDTTLDFALARELAVREGVRAIVDGHITRIGRAFDVGLRLVSSDSGRELVVLHASSSSLDGLLNAIDDVTRRLRVRIGESVKTVRATPPLPQATTSSLEALILYTRSAELPDLRSALPLMQRAVQVDTEFAIGWRRLANLYENLGMQGPASDSAAARAFRFRFKATPMERLRIEEQYYRLRDDRPRAEEASEQIIASGDSVPGVLNQLALVARSRRDFELGERLSRAALRVALNRAPNPALFIGNLSGALIDRNKLSEADSLLRAGAARTGGSWEITLAQLRLRYHKGALEDYAHALDSTATVPDAAKRREIADLRRQLALVRGRVREWQRIGRESSAAGPNCRSYIADCGSQTTPVALIPASLIELARIDLWIRRDIAGAIHRLERAFAHGAPTPAHDLVIAEMFGNAGRGDLARKALANYESRADTADERRLGYFVHRARAAIASAERRFDEALAETRRGDVRDDGPVDGCNICFYAKLAAVFDRAGMADSAITMYEAYVSTRNVGHGLEDRWRLAHSLERLGSLYDARGNHDRAVEYYSRFIVLWKDADPELQPRVKAARRRVAQLGKQRSRTN